VLSHLCSEAEPCKKTRTEHDKERESYNNSGSVDLQKTMNHWLAQMNHWLAQKSLAVCHGLSSEPSSEPELEPELELVCR
jgi:hypothetical protein